MNRYAFTAVLWVSILSFAGCATLEVPYVPPGHACGWDPVFGSCDTCGTCGGTCEGHTPASYIGHQLRCASGCGEIYWGPWLSHPPEHCDPCDDCGNWVGDRCCEPKLRERFWWMITGQHGTATGGKGIASCGSKGCSPGGVESSGIRYYEPDEPYYESDEPRVAPHEAPTPELLPEMSPPSSPLPETPATIRPAQGVTLSLPFSIRSTRLER